MHAVAKFIAYMGFTVFSWGLHFMMGDEWFYGTVVETSGFMWWFHKIFNNLCWWDTKQ